MIHNIVIKLGICRGSDIIVIRELLVVFPDVYLIFGSSVTCLFFWLPLLPQIYHSLLLCCAGSSRNRKLLMMWICMCNLKLSNSFSLKINVEYIYLLFCGSCAMEIHPQYKWKIREQECMKSNVTCNEDYLQNLYYSFSSPIRRCATILGQSCRCYLHSRTFFFHSYSMIL